MDKNAIKKYATWARRELIARVSQKAIQYGITADGHDDANADSVNGTLLTEVEKKQRQALIAQIDEKGYGEVMEGVAYTWFNRFSALRFMEVNGYLPTHVRVFTDEENNFKPQIITEAIHLELDGLDMEKVYAYKEANQTDELYKYLLITQCNALNSILPGMFQKIEDYTELLFPDNLLREGSAIEQMIALIPEDDWKNAVQIIGWLYQYYNADKKDEVFAALKKNVKITKDNIPAATQVFTPDWIVRYMVENSLGRLWLEGHPANKNVLLPTKEEQAAYCAGKRDPHDKKWHYYLEEEEQEPDVQKQLAEIRKECAGLKPQDIKCIDPCMGSGHILVYMFDVLMQIYEAYGYSSRESVESIVKNNIYGLDIDDRAAQLANFAVMIKARQYDRRFFSRGIQPHVYAVVESNHLDRFTVEYFANGDVGLKNAIKTIIDELHDAKEYGSILTVTQQNWNVLYARFDEIRDDINMSRNAALNDLLPLVQMAQNMAQKYDVVITNPPYMSSSGMGDVLQIFVKSQYPEEKSDLSTVMMTKCLDFTKNSGFMAMINIPVWMFISSYSDLRKKLINKDTIVNMLHLGRGVFGSDFGTTSFVFRKVDLPNYTAVYRKLHTQVGNVDTNEQKEKWLFEGFGYYTSKKSWFLKIPTTPIAYWLSESAVQLFVEKPSLQQVADPRQGLATGNDEMFLRLWSEVVWPKIGLGCKNIEQLWNHCFEYAPFNKGGAFRKWYGNNNLIIRFSKANYEKLLQSGNHLPSRQLYFKSGITWSALTAGDFSGRFCNEGFVFAGKGPMCFTFDDADVFYLLGFLNSKLTSYYMKAFSSTTDFNQGPMRDLPLIMDKTELRCKAESLVKNNISLATTDWDSFETSWDFQRHPLISVIAKNRMLFDDVSNIDLAECFIVWEKECNERFSQLKANEEELNHIFIDIYGLQDELTPEEEDKDVTVRKADLQRDIKSLISYAVGCMFGRYSLDEPGLVYAGGEWDSSKYKLFPADKDNIIPTCGDEYFNDDIVGRFIEFVKIVYGKNSLEANLQFIADALGGKGSAREVIRNYFLNDFYKDHCKTYQKRPIYWMFDSGKNGGFKALIYMHRYQQDTLARMRTDYVHEQQARYHTEIADLEKQVAGASTAQRVKLNKRLSTIQAQADELHDYEEKIHHLADQMICIDLDDGVKHNYEIFKDVLAKIK